MCEYRKRWKNTKMPNFHKALNIHRAHGGVKIFMAH